MDRRIPTTLKTLPFEPADALDSPEEQVALLEEAFASGDPRVVTGALGMIARARGIGKVALEHGLSREALYNADRPGRQSDADDADGHPARDGVETVSEDGVRIGWRTRGAPATLRNSNSGPPTIVSTTRQPMTGH